jgi:replication factor A1
MKTEEIVQAILAFRKDLELDEVVRIIKKKQREASGYLTYEAAASIVAFELGVKIPRETIKRELSIQDVVSGLNNVTLTGRVIAIYTTRSFRRSDKKEGKVARLLIADKSGTMKVVLWDDKVNLLETRKIEQRQIIRVLHAYTREGLDGKIELHLGVRGELQVNPSDINENDYPIDGYLEKIGNITQNQNKVNVTGVAKNLSPMFEFKRKDGTFGKVRKLGLEDDTGRITVVFWNEKVDELFKVEDGNSLSMINARIKKLPDGKLELHVEDSTIVKFLGET